MNSIAQTIKQIERDIKTWGKIVAWSKAIPIKTKPKKVKQRAKH